MNSNSRSWVLSLSLFLFSFYHLNGKQHVEKVEDQAQPQKWALLVAASKGFEFYGHQATVCHAYQTLKANGIPPENIIVMMYDDVAFDERNPEKGTLRNHPDGPDVYDGVPVDYNMDSVNAEVFKAVLTSDNETASLYEGSGRVIRSGPEDAIFLYFVGLGSQSRMTFPSGNAISGNDFAQLLDGIRNDGKAHSILVLLETIHANSIGHQISRNNNILAITATSRNEIPREAYCLVKNKMCYGSLFGVIWTDHMDRRRLLKSKEYETVNDLFQYIRSLMPSKTTMHGHLENGHNLLKQYVGYKHEQKILL